MDKTLDRRAIEVIDQVCELPTDQISEAVLRLCEDDETLKGRVNLLLSAMGKSGGILSGLSRTSLADTPGNRMSTLGSGRNAPSRFSAGDRLADRYVIDGLLGKGGMGEVYRATDERLERTVAIKTLSDALVANAEMRDRFEREVKSVAALTDNNVVTLYDVDSFDELQFAVMEYVNGQTVRELIESRVSLDTTLQILEGVTSGLQAAHQRDIMHRDIKPENIIVSDDGVAKILDFGLARTELQSLDQQLTVSSATPGTIPYMSPEQAEAQTLDCSTDIFSLGIVVYELLTGNNPFLGANAFQTMRRICECRPPQLSSVFPQVPGELERLVHRMVTEQPQDRPSASEIKSIVGDWRRSNRTLPETIPPSVSLKTASPPASRRKGTSPAQPSLIVIPFHVEDGQQVAQSVATKIEDSLTMILTRIPMLSVASRISSLALRGKFLSPSEVRQRFQIDYILEGVLHESDKGLTANVHLIDSDTGFQIWAQQFETESEDDPHTVLLSRILARVEPQLVRAIFERLRGEDELSSRQLLLQSLSVLTIKGWNRNSFEEASELLRQSIELEDDYALTHAQLALIRGLGQRVGLAVDLEEAKREAIEHAEAALELEDMDSTVLGMAGCAFCDVGLVQRGIPILHRAIEQNPNNAQARAALGAAAIMDGEFDSAIDELTKGIELSPLDNRLAVWQSFLALAQLLSGRFEEAKATAEAGCQSDLKSYLPRVALAAVHVALDSTKSAQDAYHDAIRCNPQLTQPDIKLLVGRQYALGIRKALRSSS